MGTAHHLTAEENLAVLGRLVDHFEQRVAQPRPMGRTDADADAERQISLGTVGFRLTPTRIVAKQKMSQNKPTDVFASVLSQLDGDGPYSDPALAREMRLTRSDYPDPPIDHDGQ